MLLTIVIYDVITAVVRGENYDGIGVEKRLKVLEFFPKKTGHLVTRY